jgi:uncharacterized membrane protein HdeD (DUF308 family)
MESLVQQRLAFERERLTGWVLFAAGLLFAVGCVWLAFTGMTVSWAMAVFWVVWACFGIRRVMRARRRQRSFELEHGPTAGVRR